MEQKKFGLQVTFVRRKPQIDRKFTGKNLGIFDKCSILLKKLIPLWKERTTTRPSEEEMQMPRDHHQQKPSIVGEKWREAESD